MRLERLADKLDLGAFLHEFSSFFITPKSFELKEPLDISYAFLLEFERVFFSVPKKISSFRIDRLEKKASLKIDEIFDLVKMMRFIMHLKERFVDGQFCEYLARIYIHPNLLEIESLFLESGEIKRGYYQKLDELNSKLEYQHQRLTKAKNAILNSLDEVLVDRTWHLINGKVALLLKSPRAIKGSLRDRSRSGFFYVMPEEIEKIYSRIEDLEERKFEQLLIIEATLSDILYSHLGAVKFLKREFDFFDNLQARVNFARTKNLEIILPKGREIDLRRFRHPILKDPKPLDIELKKEVLLITGVNAGGKTMLLKSALSAAFLARYLIPFDSAPDSKIGEFENIYPIIADPQNSENNISTFAGRMIEFVRVLEMPPSLIGIDEIELGTDFEEGASLYYELVLELLKKKHKVIITTHHKALAMKMSKQKSVSLLSTLYDEDRGEPTFSFMKDSIGKSYAFSTARRFGIPDEIVSRAIKAHSEGNAHFSAIEMSVDLSMRLKFERESIRTIQEDLKKEKREIEEQKTALRDELREQKALLEQKFNKALEILKKRVKSKSEMDSNITAAKKIVTFEQKPKQPAKKDFKAGDKVRYCGKRGVILECRANSYKVLLDGHFKLTVESAFLEADVL